MLYMLCCPCCSGDLGVQENPLDLRERMANSTWLTHWGLHKDR